jgi:anti-sigma B factor antagonist
MEVNMRDDGGVLLVEPVGDIDGKTAPDFQAQVVGRMQPGGRLVINLERVAFMSSAGLRAMLLMYREAKTRGAKLALAGVNKDIRNSMSATGFLAFFVVCDKVADAIGAVA